MIKGIILLFIFLCSFSVQAQSELGLSSCQTSQQSLDQILNADVSNFSNDLSQYMANQNCDPYFLASETIQSDRNNFIKYLRRVAKVEERKFLNSIESCEPFYHSSLLVDRLFKNTSINHCDFMSAAFSQLKRSDLDVVMATFKPAILSLDKPKLKSLEQHDQWELMVSPLLWLQVMRNNHPDVFLLKVEDSILAEKTDTMSNFNWLLQQNINQLVKNDSIERECASSIANKITSCDDMAKQIESYQSGVIGCQNLKIANTQLSLWNKNQQELKTYLEGSADNLVALNVLNDYQEQFMQCFTLLKTDRKSKCAEELNQKRNSQLVQSVLQNQHLQIEKISSQHAALVAQFNLAENIKKSCGDISNIDQLKNCQQKVTQDFVDLTLFGRMNDFKIAPSVRAEITQAWEKCASTDQRCQTMALSLVKLPAQIYNEEDRQMWVDDFLDHHPSTSLVEQIKLLDVLLDKKVEVIEVDYKINRGSLYCKRPMEAVDTIVIHHTATSEDETPERINEGHLNRSPDDPWLMIGYHYLITQKSQRHGVTPKIYRGRPDNYVGAHAGGEAISREYPESLKNKLLSKKINCGKYPGILHKVNPTLDEQGNTRANDTTLAISFIGNFAAFDAVLNPTGYRPVNKIYYPSDESLRETAQLVCQLKSKYPSINKLGYHQQYKATSCPGSVKLVLNKIKSFAKEFGCTLNLQN